MATLSFNKLKNTDAIWLPNVPEHWELVKVRHLFKESTKKGFPNETLLVASQKDGVVSKDAYGKRTVEATKDLHNLKLVEQGDFVISLRSFQGGIEFAYERGIISPAYTVMKETRQIEKRYFKNLFKSPPFISLMTLCVKGIREGQNIDYPTFKNEYLPLPPIEEQRAIAEYLDKKNSEIDKFIRNKERLVELLEEEKSHFISEKVSKPKTGWENKKIKYASKVFRGKFTHRPRNDESLYDGEYPFIQTGDVARASKYITEYSQTLNKLGYKVTTEFPKGTIVMTIAANIGDVAILGFNACFPDSVIGFFPKKNILNDFLYYALKVKKDDFLQTAIVNTQMNLNVERVSSIFIDIPPFSEQQKIVSEIEEHEKYIQNAISKAQKEISSIKEYREALITDLVTGKRSVQQLQLN
jgi:type I restriction enzyme S subunit